VPGRVFALTFAAAPFIAGKIALERGDANVMIGVNEAKRTNFEMALRDAGIAIPAVLL
jgi:hypothetical protein